MIRIYKPKGITKGQIALVTVLGVFSGIYIWRPLFDEYYKKPKVEPAVIGEDK